MTQKYRLLAIAAVALTAAQVLAADGPAEVAQKQTRTGVKENLLFPNRVPGTLEGSPYLVRGQAAMRQEAAFRGGWWGISTDGAVNKIGEWQGLESSAFWDIDAITSDGHKTVDFTFAGAGDEQLDAHWRYFSPGLSAEIDFGRFIHRLDHDPFTDFAETDGVNSYIGDVTDNFAGQDYAMRIQKLDASFKGHLTENVKWRLNIWGQRKYGEREATAMNHNCGGDCHINSERQTIDWLTMEIEPVIEANLGPVTIEYSRTMRSFNQDDSRQFRSYGARPSHFADNSANQIYGVVPENFTQIDRMKFNVNLTENTQLYANVFFGNTENKYRKVNRDFNGFDIRATNTSIDRLKLTGYAKQYTENGQVPTTFPESGAWAAGSEPSPTHISNPVDRDTTTAGFKARWTPLESRSALALTGGYEYKSIQRGYVDYQIAGPTQDPAGNVTLPAGWTGYPMGMGPFAWTQPDTKMNIFHVGSSMHLTRHFDAAVRYEMRQIDDPLFGVRPADSWSIPTALNTNQPEHEDLVELEGTWTPAGNLLFSASFGFLNRNNSSALANFEDDEYPITFTAWYAPVPRWSVSGGLAFLSNWVTQDVTIGHGNWQYTGRGNPRTFEGIDDVTFNYGSRSTVVNLGSTYAATSRLTLNGSLEWVRSTAAFDDPTTPTLNLDYLAAASDVIVETTRLSTGVDYLLRDGISCYFRYIYYDYEDESVDVNSGTAHMFLGGISAIY